MEREEFCSGYCRQTDSSRMVEVIIADGKLCEADCCYGSCVYQGNCAIAAKIEDLLQD